MKYIYKHPETGEERELDDFSTSKDFQDLVAKGYKLEKSISESREDENMIYGEEEEPPTHLKISDL